MTAASTRPLCGTAGGGGAIAVDELRAVLLFLREGGIGLEAAATAGFVSAHRANDDELFAFDQALRVEGGVAAAHEDGEQLGDLFGDSQQAGHRFERTAAVNRVEARDNDALAEGRQLRTNIHNF